jgi:hypothetical protein
MELHVPTLPSELNLPPQEKQESPPQYFPLPTIMAAVGQRGKGKTYNLSLWNKWMFDNEYFTRFFVISPTYESNPALTVIPTRPSDVFENVEKAVDDLAEIVQRVKDDAIFFKEIRDVYTPLYEEYLSKKRNINKMEKKDVSYLRKMQHVITEMYQEYREIDEEINVPSKSIQFTLDHEPTPPDQNIEHLLTSRFDDIHPWFYPPPKLKKPCPLLFIDDCSHSPLYNTSRSNPLVSLTLRHRHIGGQGFGLTIQFAVQTFLQGVPRALRANTQQFLLFKTKDKATLEDIYIEVAGQCSKENFLKVYHQACRDKHDFLLVDQNPSDEQKTFRRNWDTFLIVPQDDEEQLNKKRKIETDIINI